MSYDSVPIGFDPRNVPEQYLHFEGQWAHYVEGPLMGVRGWDTLGERTQADIVYGGMVERDLLDRRMREDVALAQGAADRATIDTPAPMPAAEVEPLRIGQHRATPRFEQAGFTGDGNVDANSRTLYPASRSRQVTPNELYCEATDRPRARRFVVGMTVVAAIAGVAALIHNSSGEQAPQNNAADRAVAEAGVAPNFSCRVNGIVEYEDGTGRLQFASPLGNKIVELATINPDGSRDTLANPLPDTAESMHYIFNTSSIGAKTVAAYAQGVKCQGTFTFGRQGPGDENFVSD